MNRRAKHFFANEQELANYKYVPAGDDYSKVTKFITLCMQQLPPKFIRSVLDSLKASGTCVHCGHKVYSASQETDCRPCGRGMFSVVQR